MHFQALWSTGLLKKGNKSPQDLCEASAGIFFKPIHAGYSRILLQLHLP